MESPYLEWQKEKLPLIMGNIEQFVNLVNEREEKLVKDILVSSEYQQIAADLKKKW